jgi:polyribonucleotide nucleotidyltransferase
VSKIEEEIVKQFNIAGIQSSALVINPDDDADESIDKDEVEDVIVSPDDDVKITDDEPTAEDEASEIVIPIEKLAQSMKQQQKKKAGLNYYDALDIKISMKKLLVRVLRRMIIETGRRSDGRSVKEVRRIDVETDFLPGAHGSSLFTRGETQTIATATLGSKAMEAKFENLDMLGSKRFYLQYKFPPSCVGEVGKVGGVSRR